MKFPFVLRSEHEAALADLSQRLHDLEKHFVTKRDESGKVVETLADRVEKRKNPKLKRATWDQMRRWLENTDGGRRVAAREQ